MKTLFLIDDIIADQTHNKKRQSLLGLAILARHKGNSLWLLTQFYTAIPLNIRIQAKKIGDWNVIHKENDIIKTPEDLVSVKKQLKQGRHTCLVMRMEHPRAQEMVL